MPSCWCAQHAHLAAAAAFPATRAAWLAWRRVPLASRAFHLRRFGRQRPGLQQHSRGVVRTSGGILSLPPHAAVKPRKHSSHADCMPTQPPRGIAGHVWAPRRQDKQRLHHLLLLAAGAHLRSTHASGQACVPAGSTCSSGGMGRRSRQEAHRGLPGRPSNHSAQDAAATSVQQMAYRHTHTHSNTEARLRLTGCRRWVSRRPPSRP